MSLSIKGKKTYDATEILAPTARIMINIKVVEQQNENNQHYDQRGRANPPPHPPPGLSSLKEAYGVLQEGRRRPL